MHFGPFIQISKTRLLKYPGAFSCWLGGRKCIQPFKKLEWWGAGVVVYLEQGADLHLAKLMASHCLLLQ